MVIGITGGSGSGKSTAAQMFAGQGGLVIDADIVAREVVEKGSNCLTELVGAFGADILMPDGSLDRKKLGSIVFSDKLKLITVNKITHKYITEKILNIIAMEEQTHTFVVIDAAILFESGMAQHCDVTIAVTAPDELRIQRICARDGIAQDEALSRIRSQMPQQEMALLSDYVIDTADGIDELRKTVDNISFGLTEGGKRCL